MAWLHFECGLACAWLTIRWVLKGGGIPPVFQLTSRFFLNLGNIFVVFRRRRHSGGATVSSSKEQRWDHLGEGGVGGRLVRGLTHSVYGGERCLLLYDTTTLASTRLRRAVFYRIVLSVGRCRRCDVRCSGP